MKPLLLILLITFLTYLPALKNDFILVDDSDQILNHPQIRSIKFIPQHFFSSTYFRPESDQSYGLFYRPLMLSIYTLLYTVFGPNPSIFHLLQIIIHALNAYLFYLLLSKLTTLSSISPLAINPNFITLVLSLIFTLHPINSETVLHAANLQDVLFVFFGLIALLYLIKLNHHLKPLTLNHLSLISGLLALSLFSKETGILFCLITVLYTLLFSLRLVKITIASSIIALLVYGYFRFQLAKVAFGFDSIAKISDATLSQRLLHLPLVIQSYISTFAWPDKLTIFQYWFYDNLSLSNILLPALICLIILFSILIIGVSFIRHKHHLNHAYWFFVIWLIAGLGMHSHLIPLSQTVALRWFYFPSLGLVGLISIVLIQYVHIYRYSHKIIFTSVSILFIFLLASRTYLRIFDWRDSQTLFTHDLNEISNNNYFLQNSLASVYLDAGNFELAKPLVKDSVHQYPYFGNLNNLAIIYTNENNSELAFKYFEAAVTHKTNYTAYQNYANVALYQFKNPTKAMEISQKGLQLYPRASHLWVILALSQNQLGKKDEAIASAEQAYYYQKEPYTQAILNHILNNTPFNPEEFIKLN